MIFSKTIHCRHFCSLLKLRNPLLPSLISSNSSQLPSHSSVSLRPFSILSVFTKNADETIGKFTEPLSVIFKRAVGVPGKSDSSDIQIKDNNENAKLKEKLRKSDEEMKILKEKLRNLEEIRILNKKKPEKGKKSKLSSEKGGSDEQKGAKGNLWELFADKKERTHVAKVVEPTDFEQENPTDHKGLSFDMQVFARHLYDQGYFAHANFMPRNKFDVSYFEASYARGFLKYAALNFGKDHQEIARWLSAKDLKAVALFGCPSLEVRSVHAAKHMRKFFEIDEQKVCQKCTLKESCKHANKRCKTASNKKLHLSSVTRVLTLYAMESVPQKLQVHREIKESVSRLIKEIIRLTQNTASGVSSSKVDS